MQNDVVKSKTKKNDERKNWKNNDEKKLPNVNVKIVSIDVISTLFRTRGICVCSSLFTQHSIEEE